MTIRTSTLIPIAFALALPASLAAQGETVLRVGEQLRLHTMYGGEVDGRLVRLDHAVTVAQQMGTITVPRDHVRAIDVRHNRALPLAAAIGITGMVLTGLYTGGFAHAYCNPAYENCDRTFWIGFFQYGLPVGGAGALVGWLLGSSNHGTRRVWDARDGEPFPRVDSAAGTPRYEP